MSADTLTTITKLINSPPGQIAAGGVLAVIVWKFFDRVEAVLTDQTKLEIAVWLFGRRKVGPKIETWHGALGSVDMRVGLVPLRDWLHKVLSAILLTEQSFKDTWKLLGLGACGLAILSLIQPHSIGRQILAAYTKNGGIDASNFFGSFFFTSLFAAFGTHLALLSIKILSDYLARLTSVWAMAFLLIVNLVLTTLFGLLGIVFLSVIASFDPQVRQLTMNWVDRAPHIEELVRYVQLVFVKTRPFPWINAPMIIASASMTLVLIAALIVRDIWQWLYALSGYVLKAARRFDIGFDWFNRHFDIEKKPLQSIGLVASMLVAVVYWTAVIVSRWVG